MTADIVEQLITEIGKIKTQLSNTELQLYEANEKMSDIIENVRVRVYTREHLPQCVSFSVKFLLFILMTVSSIYSTAIWRRKTKV